ncbi:hypothetical protein FOZ63_017931 [Perkinsus olseni]|uniref:Uncharacterized protein n=1 Tax=Perkinsus olseni TaxID=32597 RepID=A0A7J6PP38_PEROL|nr:hypothetical protein FOZ63_017931 [Perkinsus olseni]
MPGIFAFRTRPTTSTENEPATMAKPAAPDLKGPQVKTPVSASIPQIPETVVSAMAWLNTGATGNFVRADVHKALAVKANTSLRWPERKSQRIATLADNKSRVPLCGTCSPNLSDAVGDGESDLVRDVHQRYPREVVHVNSTRTGRLVADFTFADEAAFEALQGKGWRAAVARARKSSHGKTLQQKQQINEAIDKLLSSGFVGYMKLASIERPPPGHSIARLNSLNPRIRGTHLVHENYLDEHLPVFTAAQAVKKEPDHFVPHSVRYAACR